jgi:hypothetical protein
MDRTVILDYLAIVRRHVASGEQILARQRENVPQLERAGYDATDARRLLVQFEQIQSLHVADPRPIGKGACQNLKMTPESN